MIGGYEVLVWVGLQFTQSVHNDWCSCEQRIDGRPPGLANAQILCLLVFPISFFSVHCADRDTQDYWAIPGLLGNLRIIGSSQSTLYWHPPRATEK